MRGRRFYPTRLHPAQPNPPLPPASPNQELVTSSGSHNTTPHEPLFLRNRTDDDVFLILVNEEEQQDPNEKKQLHQMAREYAVKRNLQWRRELQRMGPLQVASVIPRSNHFSSSHGNVSISLWEPDGQQALLSSDETLSTVLEYPKSRLFSGEFHWTEVFNHRKTMLACEATTNALRKSYKTTQTLNKGFANGGLEFSEIEMTLVSGVGRVKRVCSRFFVGKTDQGKTFVTAFCCEIEVEENALPTPSSSQSELLNPEFDNQPPPLPPTIYAQPQPQPPPQSYPQPILPTSYQPMPSTYAAASLPQPHIPPYVPYQMPQYTAAPQSMHQTLSPYQAQSPQFTPTPQSIPSPRCDPPDFARLETTAPREKQPKPWSDQLMTFKLKKSKQKRTQTPPS